MCSWVTTNFLATIPSIFCPDRYMNHATGKKLIDSAKFGGIAILSTPLMIVVILVLGFIFGAGQIATGTNSVVSTDTKPIFGASTAQVAAVSLSAFILYTGIYYFCAD